MSKPCKKVRHKSMGAALATAKRAHKGEPLNAYTCETCGFWHLGSSNQSNRIQARFDRLLANPPKLKRPKPTIRQQEGGDHEG